MMNMIQQIDTMNCGAEISRCEQYRYLLWRTWDEHKRVLIFVMLNPSTADGRIDDPTIRKCIGFAKRNGYGGIEVVNLFAYRATYPADLAAAWRHNTCKAVGLDNDQYLIDRIGKSGKDVCLAWGGHGERYPERVAQVMKIVLRYRTGDHTTRDCAPQCLGRTSSGQPRHPLMLAYTTKLEAFDTSTVT